MDAKVERNSLISKRRRIPSLEVCKLDLKAELHLLFHVFKEAYTLYEKEVIQTPPEARLRGFEARLMNIKLVQCVQKHFPFNWKIGKHGRFILRVNSYIILFKKLNKKNMPMHISTKIYQAIENQQQGTLFDGFDDIIEPIVFFGYRKDRFGEISNPKLVYIDESKAKWEITNADIMSEIKSKKEQANFVAIPNNGISIKSDARQRKASNE